METTKLCPHLAPAVDQLITSGASFINVRPGGEDIKFIYELSKGPTPNFAQKIAAQHSIEYSVCNDSHYDRESFFSCKSCKLAVSWAQEKGIINAT